ncbi:hypothetical protein VS868_09785 [Salinimicrobium sp. 3283s]|uniref:hypothetical protein n=1 Tax=Salinimicrobium sp. 3283s TaxID=3114359 RepID=UPI0031E7392A
MKALYIPSSDAKDIPYEIRGPKNGIFERWRFVRCDPFGVGIITASRLKTYDPVGVVGLTASVVISRRSLQGLVREVFLLLKEGNTLGS